MKKFVIFFLLILCPCIFLAACEDGNILQTVAFSEISSPGSDNYAFRVDFVEDTRVDNKYYDIQIKANGNKKIRIGKEYDEKKEISLTSDWQSLTTLLLDTPNAETFTMGSEAVSLIYIFTSDESATITLRAVVGGIEDNAFGTGKIITSPEKCSSEFVITTK